MTLNDNSPSEASNGLKPVAHNFDDCVQMRNHKARLTMKCLPQMSHLSTQDFDRDLAKYTPNQHGHYLARHAIKIELSLY